MLVIKLKEDYFFSIFVAFEYFNNPILLPPVTLFLPQLTFVFFPHSPALTSFGYDPLSLIMVAPLRIYPSFTFS